MELSGDTKFKTIQSNLYSKAQEIYRNLISEIEPEATQLDVSKLIRFAKLNSNHFTFKEEILKMIENYRVTDMLLQEENKEFNVKLSEADFCNFISGVEIKNLLFTKGINNKIHNIEEIISLYYLMGGDKDGISCERLNSCLATFYNIYENGDFTSEVNSSNNRDYQYEAQQIINLLGSKSNNRLSLQDFVNLMTSESV